MPDAEGPGPAEELEREEEEALAGRAVEVTITLGPDGRVYFHDLPGELLPVACALAPFDEELLARARVAAASDETGSVAASAADPEAPAAEGPDVIE